MVAGQPVSAVGGWQVAAAAAAIGCFLIVRLWDPTIYGSVLKCIHALQNLKRASVRVSPLIPVRTIRKHTNPRQCPQQPASLPLPTLVEAAISQIQTVTSCVL